MSQQVPDLRRSVQVLRRHKVLAGIVVALGLLIGGAYTALNPPMLISTTLIVLPQSASNTQTSNSTGQSTISPYTATQLVIADSNQVLAAALPDVRPAMSLDKLRRDVQVSSITSYIISVSAEGKSAADAEATANAVADSYVAYANSPSSPIEHVSARVLQSATNATGTGPIKALVITSLIGGLAGALIGIIVSLAIDRKDRRLRERDEIANSIGIPVLASVPVGHPSDAKSWTKLLEDYKPAAVHAWRLRAALQHLGMVGQPLGNGDGGHSLAVLSLSSDPGALALGPQLAVFAASQGIPTLLVIGPHHDAGAAATLSTACAVPPTASSKRPDLLRAAVANDGDVDRQPGAALIVVVAVIDSRAPKIPDIMRTTATVIGVSAGAVTAEQLARAAVVASADGREINGMLVANPDPADRTTGRIPHLAPPTRRRMPSRLKGIVTEIRR